MYFSFLKRIITVKAGSIFILFFLLSFLMPKDVFSLTLSEVKIKIVPEYLGFQTEVHEKNGAVHSRIVIDGKLSGDFKGKTETIKLFLPKEAKLDSVLMIEDGGRYKKPDYKIDEGKGFKSLTFKKGGKRFTAGYLIYPSIEKNTARLDYSFHSPDNIGLLKIEIVKPVFAKSFKISNGASPVEKKSRKRMDETDHFFYEFKNVERGRKINLGIFYSADPGEREERLKLYSRSFPAFIYGSALSYNGYKAAIRIPHLLENIPCYCGCGQFGHTGLKDCFFRYDDTINDHASGCHICNTEALEVDKLEKQGSSLRDIRAYIEKKYGVYGISTPTPPII